MRSRYVTQSLTTRNADMALSLDVNGDGELVTKTVGEWAAVSGTDPRLILRRLLSNSTKMEAVFGTLAPVNDSDFNGGARFITLDGVRKSISEWAVATGTKANTIFHRLRRGWDERSAVFGKE